MRSSCEASERKRRSRSSLAWRSANACSIWPSIALSARPRRPTSVRSFAGLTRRERSPAAIAPAVAPMRSSGRRPRRISSQAHAASASTTAAITISSMLRSRVSVCETSLQRRRDDQGALMGVAELRHHAVLELRAVDRVDRDQPGMRQVRLGRERDLRRKLRCRLAPDLERRAPAGCRSERRRRRSCRSAASRTLCRRPVARLEEAARLGGRSAGRSLPSQLPVVKCSKPLIESTLNSSNA